MGDAECGPIRLSFNAQLHVEFRGATVTSDAGLLLSRELDERLGLSALIERYLTDPRPGRHSQFPLPALFRQSIYSRLAGYEDTNDAERLAEDPTFRMLAARAARDERGAHLDAPLVRDRGPRGRAELSRPRAPQYGSGAARGRAANEPPRDARYRQLGESGTRRARAGDLQRPLRVRLVSSALRLHQDRRR